MIHDKTTKKRPILLSVESSSKNALTYIQPEPRGYERDRSAAFSLQLYIKEARFRNHSDLESRRDPVGVQARAEIDSRAKICKRVLFFFNFPKWRLQVPGALSI